MSETEPNGRARRIALDFDELKLGRGEIGPYVAEEFLEK